MTRSFLEAILDTATSGRIHLVKTIESSPYGPPFFSNLTNTPSPSLQVHSHGAGQPFGSQHPHWSNARAPSSWSMHKEWFCAFPVMGLYNVRQTQVPPPNSVVVMFRRGRRPTGMGCQSGCSVLPPSISFEEDGQVMLVKYSSVSKEKPRKGKRGLPLPFLPFRISSILGSSSTDQIQKMDQTRRTCLVGTVECRHGCLLDHWQSPYSGQDRGVDDDHHDENVLR